MDILWGVFEIDFFGDFLVESRCEFRVVRCQFRHVSIITCRRMLAQPHLHQSHKDSITGNKWLVQITSLSLPLFSKLACYFLNEWRKLIELLLGIVITEKVEVGVVKDFPFFRPAAILRLECSARVIVWFEVFFFHLECWDVIKYNIMT